MNIGQKGKEGEELAVEYLRKKGYIIVKRNYQTRFGEIDVIAESKTHIIFTEVKRRKANTLVSGAQAVDLLKQRRIRMCAADFLLKFYHNLQPRFDVAEIIEGENGNLTLRYTEDAFE